MREFCARCILSRKEKGVTVFVEEIMFNHVKAKSAEIAQKVMERQAGNYVKGQGTRVNQYRILDVEEIVEGTIVSRAIKKVITAVLREVPALPAPAATPAVVKPVRLDMFRGLGKPTCRFADMFKLATIDKYVKPNTTNDPFSTSYSYTPPSSACNYMGAYELEDWDEGWDDMRPKGFNLNACD